MGTLVVGQVKNESFSQDGTDEEPESAVGECQVSEDGTCIAPAPLYEDDDDDDDDNKNDDGDRQYFPPYIRNDRAFNGYSNMPQVLKGKVGGIEADILEFNAMVDDYMFHEVYVEEQYVPVRKSCVNRHELCSIWASFGECDRFPFYMKMQCAPACRSCDYLLDDVRCAFDADQEPVAWSNEGELNQCFERIVTNPEFQSYHPRALSKPLSRTGQKGSTVWSRLRNLLSRGGGGAAAGENSGGAVDDYNNDTDQPWVVVLDHFLTDQECQELTALNTIAVASEMKKNRMSDELTPANTAWCIRKCAQDATVLMLQERVQKLVQIPARNLENLKFVQYKEEGQYHVIRHDYIEKELDRYQGPRVLTVFIFLNDLPKQHGGGVGFPLLKGVEVQPKRGRAIVWPNVLDEQPMQRDGRSEYQALPVFKGTEYVVSVSVHQRNYKDTWAKACT